MKARGSGKKRGNQVHSLALKGFGLDQIWAQIEHHTSSVNDKIINQMTALMTDEDFLKNAIASTDDELEGEDEAGEADDEAGIDADYGDENEEGEEEGDEYEFEKDGDKDELELEKGKGKGGLFDKQRDSDSEVEDFMDDIENAQLDLDGLKLPSDAEDALDGEDYDDEDGPGLDDYDDESDFSKNIKDDYGDEGEKGGKDEPAEDEEDNEDEIEEVFAQAAENQEMN